VACAPPRLPIGESAASPPKHNVEGSRHQWALAAAFSPGSLPQVWGAATSRRAKERPAGRLVPSTGPNLNVDTNSYALLLPACSRTPGRYPNYRRTARTVLCRL
jgi:hypothetical protein